MVQYWEVAQFPLKAGLNQLFLKKNSNGAAPRRNAKWTTTLTHNTHKIYDHYFSIFTAHCEVLWKSRIHKWQTESKKASQYVILEKHPQATTTTMLYGKCCFCASFTCPYCLNFAFWNFHLNLKCHVDLLDLHST